MTNGRDISTASEPPLRWAPVVGPFTADFKQRKLTQRGAPDAAAMDQVVSEALKILGRCLPPSEEEGREAGLVVGYVQSGKTLSFITVAALARDNGYGAVILLAGTAVNLKSQSERRLVIDLGLEDTQHDWRHFENPTVDRADHVELGRVLRSWRSTQETRSGTRKRSLLITVLKHHQRLSKLAEVLREVDLKGVPVLIIDDESDQASLNLKARKNKTDGTDEKSTTYDRILQLREAIPHHTYLQYTATPQANLLIAMADVLSPKFAELVSPGSGYVGGLHFFNEENPLCVDIPPGHIPTHDNPLVDPPESLQDALRIYLVGAAHHNFTRAKGNRSMMIHPSQRTDPHRDYKTWIDGLLENWREFLEQPADSGVKREMVRVFRQTYDSVRRTFPAICSFDEVMETLPDVFSDLKVVKVNSNADGEREVRWNTWPYWILVGGQKLDRGFTVEGLTVTYMPRVASSNADTLQQRARFFGYKRSYEGLCRIFLLPDVNAAFRSYVNSEEFIRTALQAHVGKPLQEWKRDFILHRALNPTRPSVVGREVTKVEMDEGWIVPGALYKDVRAVESNRQLFIATRSRWKASYSWRNAAEVPKYRDVRRSSSPNMLIESVPISEVLDFFLGLQVRDIDDSSLLAAVALSLVQHQADVGALADVFVMGDLEIDGLTGRSLTASGKLNNLFVGKQPQHAIALQDLIYVGDRALWTEGRVSVHIRFIKLKPNARVDQAAGECVPWIAVHLPKAVAEDCYIEQG